MRCLRLLILPPLRCASLALLAGCLAAGCANTRTAAPRTDGAATTIELGRRIDRIIGQPRFAAASWGVAVVSLDSGRTLYLHDAGRLLQPASTAKLFTAALSLSILGADHRLATRLLGHGRIRHGRLDGPLILYGMGDPTLGTETSPDWADQLAAQLTARGVHRVHGDLIADDTYFAGPPFGDGWEAGDLQAWFATPASALSVQENMVELTASPGAVVGAPVELAFAPPVDAPVTHGSLATSRAGTADDINLYRAPGHNTLQLFGSMPLGAPSQHIKLSVPDPALLAGRQLLLALARQHIRVDGTLQVLHWPSDDANLRRDASTLAEISSPPLMEILHRGLKRSQNLYLQNLLLVVGARQQALEEAASPAAFTTTEAAAIKALQPLLAQIGIDPEGCMLSEGSGLSRRDLVTPRAMVTLLAYLARQPYADALRDALPIAAVDGTLAHRFAGTAAATNLHAKTGSMTYVHSLAGYVTTAAGERLAFAIMLDNYEAAAEAPSASSDIDAIAVELARLQHRS